MSQQEILGEAKNVIEEPMEKPQYIDLSKSHKNEDLFALRKNSLRVEWTPSSISNNSFIGTFTFNNIQPPNFDTGISDVYIEAEVVFTLNMVMDSKAKTNGEKIHKLLTKNSFFNDFNCALYNTSVSIGSQNLTSQPYISYAIKRLYDKNFYDSSFAYNQQDVNVSAYITDLESSVDTAASFEIHYKCSTPLCHPYFYTTKDLCGINSFNIQSSFNLYNIFSVNGGVHDGEDIIKSEAGTNITSLTLSLNQFDLKLSYNENIYSQPLSTYSSLIMSEYRYTEKTIQIGGDTNTNFLQSGCLNCNVRDAVSTPICQYVLLISDPEQTRTINAVDPQGKRPFAQWRVPKYRLKSLQISVNSNPNAYSSNSFNSIYHCCKKAGYCGTFDELYFNDLFPQVFAFSSLQYRNVINSSDTYRFSIDQSILEENVLQFSTVIYLNASSYVVYEYPSVLISSVNGTNSFISIAPFSAMEESEEEIDTYLREIEQAGYSGGSLWTWLKSIKDKLKRGRYISKFTDAAKNVLASETLPNVLSVIPGVNKGTVEKVLNTANTVNSAINSVAKSAGYGTNTTPNNSLGTGIRLF